MTDFKELLEEQLKDEEFKREYQALEAEFTLIEKEYVKGVKRDKDMNEIQSAEQIKTLTAPILERGFTFEYLYQKGGDSSCVYICRYKKGKNFLDWREVSGGDEINIVVYVNGEYRFPSLKTCFPKAYKAFKRKHLFKKPTVSQRREFVAACLLESLNHSDFFGIVQNTWNNVETQKDIEILLRSFCDFHDSCISTIQYKSGNTVKNDNSMHFGTQEDYQLNVVFESQWCDKIEVRFNGVRRLHLVGLQDNYMPDIYGVNIQFYDDILPCKYTCKGKLIVWTDGDGLDVREIQNNISEPSNSYIIAHSLQWRRIKED